MKRLTFLCLWLLSVSAAFSALQTPINFNFTFDGTNTVQVAWNAYPGKSYVLQTTTNLAGPWSSSSTLVATSNSISFNFPTAAAAQFFKVVKLDTEGPDITPISPLNGAIAVVPQSPVQVQMTDATGINTNSIILTIGTNAPVSLPNPQLAYADGLLTFTPASGVFLGTNGQMVVASISVADTLGNVTTSFTWSFQIALPTVPSANLLYIPGSSGFVLVSTNGDNYTFSYAGSFPGLSIGEILVNTNLATGYTVTVLSYTNNPASNNVVVLTRPTTVAEMLQLGSLSSANFTQLGSSGNAAVAFSLKGATKTAPTGPVPKFGLNNTANLQGTVYQDGNVLIELLSGSQLTLNSDLGFGANFNGVKLRQFSATFSAGAAFTLNAHVHATGALDRSGSTPMITPVHQIYAAVIPGTFLPVWVELVLELNAGYNLHLTASADYTTGISGNKQILTSRSWTESNGWTTFSQNPDGGFSVLGPTWQLETTGSLRVYLQPKLTLYLYSVAGASGDLEPYLELDGNAQVNPVSWALALNAGLTSTIGLDLRGWDASWGDLPDKTWDLIPSTLLWETSSSPSPPQITNQPASQWVTTGGTATFTVTANGPGTLTYRWLRNGLYLTDDSHLTGSRSSTLQITRCSTSDTGNYSVLVGNPNGSITSQDALLTIYTNNIPTNANFISDDLYIGFQNYYGAATADYIINIGPAIGIVGGSSVVDVSAYFSLSKFILILSDDPSSAYGGVVGGNAFFPNPDVYATQLRTSNIGTPSLAGSSAPTTITVAQTANAITQLSSIVAPAPGPTGTLDFTKSWESYVEPSLGNSFYGQSGINPDSDVGTNSVVYEDLYYASSGSAFAYQGYFTLDFTSSSPKLTFTPKNAPSP